MNSTERHQARYERRKAKREAKKKEYLESLGTFEEVLSYENLYNAFFLCQRGVNWKASVQSYRVNLPTNTWEIYSKLMSGKWKSKGFVEFDIMERGKKRHIQSVDISERCLQRAFSDHYLVPAMSKGLIYDNGASIKGKGTDFALKRLKKHLYDYYRKNGNEGYVLVYDFSNYFGSIKHDKLFEIAKKYFVDERLWALYNQLIGAFKGGEGLGLGSQCTQISAVMFPNLIDHHFKDKLGVKGYGRYMDDGYIIAKDLSDVKFYKEELFKLCDELGIVINSKKIKICKLNKGFTWLKKRIFLTDTGKVIMKLYKKSIAQERRKLKKLVRKSYLTYEDIYICYRSWKGNALKYNNYHTVRNMDKLFNDLLIAPFIRGEVV